MRPHLLPVLLLAAALPAADWLPEATAPTIQPELLVHAAIGGAGDQQFIAVRTTAKGADATDGTGLSCSVAIAPPAKPGDPPPEAGTDPVTVKFGGNKNLPSTKEPVRLLTDSGTVNGVTYGFKQVHAILQQPFAHGKGWKLWGWDHAAASKLNLMADSRMKGGFAMPNGNVLLIGGCDGGNTSLHRDPRDIEKKSPYMRYGHGGGKGASLLYTELVPATGEVLRQAFLGPGTGGVIWDPWGRLITVGTNLCKGGKAPFDTGGSGSLLIFNRDWTTPLLDCRLGSAGGSYKDNMWHSVALDHERGILVLAGWTAGKLEKPVRATQTEPGGDKDAMIAVIRLWTPEAYAAAIEAAKAAAQKK